MRFLILIFLSWSASAQISVQESDSSNQLRIFKRSVNFNFFNVSSLESDLATDDGGRLSSYSYLTGATWVNHNYRLALRLPFLYNTAGTDRFADGQQVHSQELSLQDVIIGMQNYNLLMLPWDLELYWDGRMYLPTSTNSKRSGLITRFRNEFILSRVFSRYFEMEYNQKFSYFAQSRSTYANTFTDEDGYERTVASSTKKMEFENDLRAWFRITPKFAAGWQVGTMESYRNKSVAENRSNPAERTIHTGPAVAFPITTSANFILIYDDVVDRDTNKAELGRFAKENTQVTLLSFIRF